MTPEKPTVSTLPSYESNTAPARINTTPNAIRRSKCSRKIVHAIPMVSPIPY
jgi:hypothetical protein